MLESIPRLIRLDSLVFISFPFFTLYQLLGVFILNLWLLHIKKKMWLFLHHLLLSNKLHLCISNWDGWNDVIDGLQLLFELSKIWLKVISRYYLISIFSPFRILRQNTRDFSFIVFFFLINCIFVSQNCVDEICIWCASTIV